MFKIELNDNYKVIEIPENQSIMLPNNTGQMLFSVKQVGNTLNLMFKIDFKEATYDPEYYPFLKKFMTQVVDIQKISVILLKNSN